MRMVWTVLICREEQVRLERGGLVIVRLDSGVHSVTCNNANRLGYWKWLGDLLVKYRFSSQRNWESYDHT